jgi:microcystin-dependent protein
LPIAQYQALFSLLGTYFGGDGIRTFQLPNLQGATPVGVGNGINYGQLGGEPAHTLTQAEVPTHTHAIQAAGGADKITPAGNLVAGGGTAIFGAAGTLAGMNPNVLATFGGSLPHENRQPYLVMNWVIALVGIFPSRD